MRSERLLSTLLLLQAKRRRSAAELARELNVSMRTVYRDVDALGAAGVPIYTERGAQGGIVLSDDYRRALAQFDSDEIASLFASATGPLADLGIVRPQRALDKIAGALTEGQRRAAEGVRERLLLDSNKWYRDDQPTDMLAILRGAIANDRCVTFTYRDRAGSLTERRADPLGLVAKAGIWYLVARTDHGMRTFRAQRIGDVTALDERFERPAEFSLADYWQSSIASLEDRPKGEYHVVIRIAASALERVTPYWDLTVQATDGDDAIARLRFPNANIAAFGILALDVEIEVLEPADLIANIVTRAHAALARFA